MFGAGGWIEVVWTMQGKKSGLGIGGYEMGVIGKGLGSWFDNWMTRLLQYTWGEGKYSEKLTIEQYDASVESVPHWQFRPQGSNEQ